MVQCSIGHVAPPVLPAHLGGGLATVTSPISTSVGPQFCSMGPRNLQSGAGIRLVPLLEALLQPRVVVLPPPTGGCCFWDGMGPAQTGGCAVVAWA